ncbi:hypothetical protein LSH36_1724g00000 [Paralvinella palmiformis]|uniref:G-protein coupled receptors family 1 profile domain-containing protein n=1 Tax=Paralvinella palmiformis TaxID=53620 RepID=A0AAD9IRY0_9ANNE|nr:hypothetical protein LSH36_1724g00000 [Paralvinella palmiformis]
MNDTSATSTSAFYDWTANVSRPNDTDDVGNSGETTLCCSPGVERFIVPFVFSIVVILGCLGNVLVIVVVIKNRDHYRNTTNLFILNLAIADVLFLVFCVPFHAVIYTTIKWPFGEFMCKAVHLVQYSSMVASVLTLVAMSIDRYMAVGYPLMTKHVRTPTTAFLISVVIWVLSIAMAMPWPIFYTVREYTQYGPEPIPVCADDWGAVRKNKPIYFLVLFVLGYAFPLLIIFVLSVLMIRQLWSVSSGAHYREGSLRAKRKVTRLVIVVVFVFSLCWLPSHVTWLWINFEPLSWKNTYAFYYLKISAHILAYANSCMNPVIYAFLSTQFRKGFNRALRIKCPGDSSLTRTPQSSVRFHSSKSVMYSMTPSLVGIRHSLSVADTTL